MLFRIDRLIWVAEWPRINFWENLDGRIANLYDSYVLSRAYTFAEQLDDFNPGRVIDLFHTPNDGIIRLIFNYGDVIINVGQTQFLFYGVKNPDEVQQDIVAYIEARRRLKQDEAATRERERMLDWFSTYHNQSEKLEEVEKKSDWDLFPG